ncbi:hypothetical protein [Zavarzinella formosa]|uniref:hypothetical protein n=1 Tax=Zavarzinella formosa TaxID=360055 RepID=UPI00031DB51D|nr:hypothetical protein [Zavarzinella formosa]
MRTLSIGTESISGDCRAIFSVRRFGGHFVAVRYTATPVDSANGLQVVSPEGAVMWTVPPAEWERLQQFDQLPYEWRLPAGRPLVPDAWPLVEGIRNGVTERVQWWAETRGICLTGLRLTLDKIRVHPTDTTPGICEQAGREIADELVAKLSAKDKPA